MKKRLFALVLAVMMMALLIVSCADNTDWDNVPKATVIATVDEYEVNMDLIKYYYAEQYAVTKIGSSLSGSLDSAFAEATGESASGSSSEKANSKAYQICIEDIMMYAAMERVAEDKGLAETYEKGREQAYEDLILLSKSTTMTYYAQYLSAIKDNYTATDDALCDIAGELYRLRMSAEKLVEDYFEKGGYETEEEAVSEITKLINEDVKALEIKQIFPSSKSHKVDVGEYVAQRMTFKTFK